MNEQMQFVVLSDVQSNTQPQAVEMPTNVEAKSHAAGQAVNKYTVLGAKVAFGATRGFVRGLFGK